MSSALGVRLLVALQLCAVFAGGAAGRRRLLSVADGVYALHVGGDDAAGSAAAAAPVPACVYCSAGSSVAGCGGAPAAGWYVAG